MDIEWSGTGGVDKWAQVSGVGNGFSVSMSGVEKWAQVVMEMGFQ